LVIVTRRDLSPGLQAVQSVHAAVEFCFQYPHLSKNWHFHSNYIILLTVENEQQLLALSDEAYKRGIKYAKFHEPDIGNQFTALALSPGEKTQKLTSYLPLLLKEKKVQKNLDNSE